jgi:hypothetical protein
LSRLFLAFYFRQSGRRHTAIKLTNLITFSS